MPWVPLGPLNGPSQTWMPAGPAEKRPPRPTSLRLGRGEQLAGLALSEDQSGADVAGQRGDGDDAVLEPEPGDVGPPSGTTWSGHRYLPMHRWPEPVAPGHLGQYRSGSPRSLHWAERVNRA